MPKKPKSSSAPRSLFKDVETLAPVPEFFRSYADQLDTGKLLAGAKPVVEQEIERMRALAHRASIDPHLERGAELAATLNCHLDHLQTVQAQASYLIAHAARAALDPKLERDLRRKFNSAIWDAMKAVETWMMLRADALFAPAVRSRERSDANIGHRVPLTPAQAVAALQRHGTKTAAAEFLGISRVTLDKLLKV